jgi:hypothetical protein
MAGKIYVSTVTGVTHHDGSEIQLVAGITRVREGHPLLEGRGALFKELSVHYDVETARQAPKAEAKPEPVKAEVPAEAAPAPKAAPPARPQRGPRKA